MQTIKEYDCFNQRRFSNPWVAEMVDGKISFDKKVGEYTGGYMTGEAGSLVVYAPEEGKVYAYGQKDNRGNKGDRGYVVYADGKFQEIAKENAIELS